MAALRSPLKTRLLTISGLLIAVLIALAARYGLEGFWAKYLGVTLWATCLYTLLLAIQPNLRIIRAAGLALVISWAVEFAQLTGIPALLSSRHIILRWIFGSYFSLWDLPAYVVGVGLGVAFHGLLRRLFVSGRGAVFDNKIINKNQRFR